MTGALQFAIVRLVDPEFELPSRVSPEDHDDDAVTTPSPLGIATVNEDVLPANDAVPCVVVLAPLVGLNTITHAGVFRPPFPLPDELKYVQSRVTDPQVEVAVIVCAAALAAEIASTATASRITCRERRNSARLLPTSIVSTEDLLGLMLEVLSVGRVRDLRRHGGTIRARLRATRSYAATRPPTSARAGWLPTRLVLEALSLDTADWVPLQP
jgi:hypothetical protein